MAPVMVVFAAVMMRGRAYCAEAENSQHYNGQYFWRFHNKRICCVFKHPILRHNIGLDKKNPVIILLQLAIVIKVHYLRFAQPIKPKEFRT